MNQAHKAWATKKLYVSGNESQWWTPFAAPSGTISLHSVQPSAGSTSPPLRLPPTLISSQGAPSFSISSSCSVRMVWSTRHRMSSTAALQSLEPPHPHLHRTCLLCDVERLTTIHLHFRVRVQVKGLTRVIITDIHAHASKCWKAELLNFICASSLSFAAICSSN